jgi:hypothetical protein
LTNRDQKRQFDEAVRRIEAELRKGPNADRHRKLSAAERRRLHDEITGQRLTDIDEIKDWGLAMFPR